MGISLVVGCMARGFVQLVVHEKSQTAFNKTFFFHLFADELQTNLSSSEQTGQKVALELADLKKRLREQKRQTETANQNAQKFQELLVKARTQLRSLVEDCNTVLVGERKDDKSEIKTEVKREPSENGIN